jgi:hypothetical protein
MIQNKKTDIAIQGHEGKVPGAVVIHNAIFLLANAPKQKMLAID